MTLGASIPTDVGVVSVLLGGVAGLTAAVVAQWRFGMSATKMIRDLTQLVSDNATTQKQLTISVEHVAQAQTQSVVALERYAQEMREDRKIAFETHKMLMETLTDVIAKCPKR